MYWRSALILQYIVSLLECIQGSLSVAIYNWPLYETFWPTGHVSFCKYSLSFLALHDSFTTIIFTIRKHFPPPEARRHFVV